MKLSEMKLSFPRDRWFSRGNRATQIVPIDLQMTADEDDRYQNRRKATLTFQLPRGGYATMLIKTLTGVATDGGPDGTNSANANSTS